MELVKDFDAFDDRQAYLARELVKSVHLGLAHLDLPPRQLKEAVTTVVFNVCNVIDGTSVVEVDGTEVVPFLTFDEEEGAGRLITSGSSSFLHEKAHGAVDSYFKKNA